MKHKLFFISIFVLLISACGGKKELIIGEWQMQNFQVNDPNAGSKVQEIMVELSKSTRYSFLEDQTYIIYTPNNPDGKAGSWTVAEDGQSAYILQMGNEPKQVLAVEEIEPGLLRCSTKTTRMGDIRFELKLIDE